MDIRIVGDGKVGFTLASQLDHEGHNVTVIDNKTAVLEKTLNSLDVVGGHGNGATPETLLRAKANLAEAIMIEHKVVERESVDQILVFFGAWMVIITLGAMIVSLDDFDFGTTLSFCMLLGRLEIYPILIFLLPIITLTQKKKVKIGKVDYN